MIDLLYIELFKLFRTTRTYVTFGIAGALMLIVNLGMYMEGQKIIDFLLSTLEDYFFIEGKVLNAYLVTYLALNSLWVHLPVLVVIIGAWLFAGEFESGTIRLLMMQPIRREALFSAKFIAMVIYNLIFMVITVITALLPALLLFGTGDLIVFMDGIQFLEEGSVLMRLVQAMSFATLSMIAFSCLGMFFGLVLRSTLTSVLLSMGLLILSTLLQKFVFGLFSGWQPLLFSYHFSKWQYFFMDAIPYGSIGKSFLFMLSMTVILYIFSLLAFKKMNITD